MPRVSAPVLCQMMSHKCNSVRGIPFCMRYCAVARKHVGRTRVPGEYSGGRYSLLFPQRRTRDWRLSSLRLSLFVPFVNCSARSLTLRLCLLFLSDFVELASLAVETWRKNVRENQLRVCCSGGRPGYRAVRTNSLCRVGEVTNHGESSFVGGHRADAMLLVSTTMCTRRWR